MAAAPELLKIVETYLQELLHDYREFTGDDQPEVGEVLIIDECVAVIAKAIGSDGSGVML